MTEEGWDLAPGAARVHSGGRETHRRAPSGGHVLGRPPARAGGVPARKREGRLAVAGLTTGASAASQRRGGGQGLGKAAAASSEVDGVGGGSGFLLSYAKRDVPAGVPAGWPRPSRPPKPPALVSGRYVLPRTLTNGGWAEPGPPAGGGGRPGGCCHEAGSARQERVVCSGRGPRGLLGLALGCCPPR